MASGTEMLMRQMMKGMGLNPDDIINTVSGFQEALVSFTAAQAEILEGNKRIEAKLDRLLATGKAPVIIEGKANG